MLYLIWVVQIVALLVIFWYKSKQAPMTKGEQFYELAVVAQRQNNFLLNVTKDNPYYGKD